MGGVLSLIPLRALLQAGHEIVGLMVPASRRASGGAPRRRMLLPADVVDLARARDIPIVEVPSIDDGGTFAALEGWEPDLVCVACFPCLLPRRWLDLPHHGCLNLHPSLLPAYRGPAPLFWQFRAGEERTGVTLHFMDEGADTGDIVFQAEVPFSDGITGAEAERLAAEAHARLLLEALSLPDPPRRPQPSHAAIRQGWPRAADLRIPTSWTARRAFNFVRGAAQWGPFEIETPDGTFRVTGACGFVPGGSLGAATRRTAPVLSVEFSDGIVHLTESEDTRGPGDASW